MTVVVVRQTPPGPPYHPPPSLKLAPENTSMVDPEQPPNSAKLYFWAPGGGAWLPMAPTWSQVPLFPFLGRTSNAPTGGKDRPSWWIGVRGGTLVARHRGVPL